MKVQPKALWEQCLQLIKENVTEQQYTTWFKPITFETFDATTSILLVQVPSPFRIRVFGRELCELVEQSAYPCLW